MKKLGWILLGMSAVVGASAQSIYVPTRSIDEQGITLKGWGSGTISQTDEVKGEGSWTLRVSTRNYFQGGMMTLKSPVDLGTAYNDKNNLLRFSYRVANSGLTINNNTASGAGNAGGGASGAASDAGFKSNTGSTQSGQASNMTSDAQLQKIRVIVSTSDGLKSEAFVAIRQGGDWRAVAVPLAAINGFERTNKQVTGLAFSGDATSTFYVGDVKVVNDSTPIQGEMSQKNDMNLALNDEVTLSASGFGGSSILKYTWDFDATDGDNQIDAVGQTIKRRFRKPGEYVVTVTISDLYGAKAPVKATVKVKVNP